MSANAPQVATLAQALVAEQCRQHRSTLAGSMATSGVMAIGISALMWDTVDHARLLTWLACLVVMLAIRLGVARAHGLAQVSLADASIWLGRFRTGYAAHGLMWGLLGLLTLHDLPPEQTSPIAFALIAMAAGSLVLTVFDVPAALAFAVPTLAPLVGQMLLQPHAATPGLALVLLLIFTAALVSALRSQRLVRESVRLRHANTQVTLQAKRSGELADKAQRSYELMTNSLTDMVSVISEDLVYRLVNDAWCKATGVAREQALGMYVTDVLPNLGSAERRLAIQECIALGQVRKVIGSVDLPALLGRQVETSYYPYLADGADADARCVVIVTHDVTDIEANRQRLAASDEYLRRTLNATRDAIIASDAANPNEPVRFVNQQMLQMWGIPDSLIGTLTPADVLNYGDPLFIDPAYERGRVEAIIANHDESESRLVLRDGRVLLRRCAMAEVNQRTLRVWSFSDVTQQEKAMAVLETREAVQRALLDAFPGNIAWLTADLVYTHVNTRLANQEGSTPQAMVGQSVAEVLGPKRAAELKPLFARVMAGESVTYERLRSDPQRHGRTDQVTLISGPDPRNGEPAVYSFGIDITALKDAQAELQSARDEADNANRAKSEFLSSMSHELRTPMNAILGFAQILEYDTQLSADQQDSVQEIIRGGQHLLALINQVLDLAKIESGHLDMSLETVAIGPVVSECLTLVTTLAQSRQVTLSVADLGNAQVFADRIRLKQVLLNLLSNAIKYNRQGGDVSVSATTTVSMSSQGALQARVSLRVTDTGPGIPEQRLVELFQPFNRLGLENSNIEGTGIGLTITRRIVEMMNGQVRVSSQLGVGSTFSIELPVDAPPHNDLHTAQ